jgi:hypothetical protein
MDEKYLKDLWNWTNSQDPAFKDKYTFDTWSKKLNSNDDYKKQFYGWVSGVDETFQERRPYDAWSQMVSTDKKKEESALFSREGGTLSATPGTEPQKPSAFSQFQKKDREYVPFAGIQPVESKAKSKEFQKAEKEKAIKESKKGIFKDVAVNPGDLVVVQDKGISKAARDYEPLKAKADQLQEKYGDLGFKFEASEATFFGDDISVTADDGTSIFINTSSINENNAEDAKKLQEFLFSKSAGQKKRELTPAEMLLYSKREDYQNISKAKYDRVYTDENIKKSLTFVNEKINADLSGVKETQKELSELQAKIQAMGDAAPQETIDDYDSKVNMYNSKLKDIKSSAMIADQSVKNVVAERLERDIEKGNWESAVYNSLVNGTKNLVSGTVDVLYEGTDMLTGPILPMDKQKKAEQTKAIKEWANSSFDQLKAKNVTDAYLQDQNWAMQALFSVPEFLPTLMVPGGPIARIAAMSTQGVGRRMEEYDNSPEMQKIMSREEAFLLNSVKSVVEAKLENVGITQALSKSGLANSLVIKALQKWSPKMGNKALNNLVNMEINNLAAKATLNTAGAFIAEAETGALQNVMETSINELYNAAKEKNVFDQPKVFTKEWMEGVAKDAVMEGLGGMWMGGAANVARYTAEGVLGAKLNNDEFKLVKLMLSDGYTAEAMMVDLKNKVVNGQMTAKEMSQTVANFQKAATIVAQMPEGDLSLGQQRVAFDLINERTKLEGEIAGKDPNLVSKKKNRINEINEKLKFVSENAVQEQTTSEVPVQPEAAVGEEVAQGATQAEPEVVTEQGKEEVTNIDTVVVTDEKVVPAGKRLFNEPNEETAQISKTYKEKEGISSSEGSKIEQVDTERAMSIADAYEAMKDAPDSPEVQEAYNAMADETAKQHQAILDSGYEVEIWEGEGEPYANAQEMIDDVKNNKHMYIYSTEQGFGDSAITEEQRKQNKLLKDSGFKDKNGKTLLYNDLFRFVHDFFGHTERGNGFGAIGEENAWDVHSRMYSPVARKAMTTETRGQNSWVNFGPQVRNKDGKIIKKGEPGYLAAKDRQFAPQKMGLLPAEFSEISDEKTTTTTTETGQQQTVAAEQGTPTTIEGTGLRENIKKSIAKVFKKFEVKSFKNANEMAAYAKATYNQETGANDAARVFAGEQGVEILVNEELSDDTALGHEVWHALLLKAFGDNQKQFAAFRGAINKTLRENGYEDIADSLDEFTSEYTAEDEVPAEEYLAQLGGLMTSANIDLKNLTPAQKTLLEQIKDIINEFAIKLTGQPVFLKDATAETILDFMSTMSEMMAKGEDISGFFGDEAGRVIDQGDVTVNTRALKKTKFKNNKFEVKQPIFNPANGKATGFTFIADRMATGEWTGLDPASGIKIPLMGGIGYPMLKKLYKKAGWAVDGGSVMSTFLNKIVNSKTGIGFPVLMSEYAHVSNLTFSKIFEAEMNWMVKSGQITAEEQLENVNKYISESLVSKKDLSPKMKEDPKTGKLMDKNTNAPLRVFAVEENGKYTPKTYESMEDVYKELEGTFAARAMFMQAMIGVGVKNRYAKIEKYKFPDMVKVADEVSDPRLKGIPSGTSVSAIQFDQKKAKQFSEDISSNQKLSEKHSAKAVGVDPHISYEYVVEGQSLGWLPGIAEMSEAEGVSDETKEWYDDQRKKFKEGKISEAQLRSNVTAKSRASMPEVTIKTRAQKVQKVQKETNFVPVSFWVESLKGNIDYLDNVIKHILEARNILKSGNVPQKMTTKSYLITLSSMGSGGGYYDNWKAKTGKTVEDIFIEKQNGREWLRPEGAAAAFLSTEEGKALVVKINEGTATKEEIKEIFDFVGTGRESSKSDYVISTMQSGGLKSMTDLFNENKGEDFSELFAGAIKNLKGIGEGKTGFFNQYFGVSSRGVVDARQMNAWVAGQMKLTDEQKALKKKIESSPKLQAELLAKIEEVGIELGYPEDLAAYIAHHAIWDGIANNITKHEGEYIVTRAQKAQPQTIPGYDRMIGEAKSIVEKSRKRRVSAAQIAENVINYIQGSAVYERADDLQREQIIRDARKELGLRQKSAPSVDRLLGKIKDIKKVTVTEKSALKELLKAEAKGARTAVQARSQAAKALNDMLKKLEKKGSIKATQVRAIMTRYSKVNFFSSSSMDNFVNYMAKVFSDAEYNDKLKTASKTANSVRRLIKNASLQAGTKAVAKKFLDIDPRLVEDIDKYLEFAKALNEAVRTSTSVTVDGDIEVILKKAIDYNEFQDYMDAQILAQEEYIKNQLAEIHKDLVDAGVIDTSMSLADMKAIIDAINSEDSNTLPSEEKERMIRAYLGSVMDSYTGLIQYMLDNSMDPFSLELVSISQSDRDIISRFINMDLNKLPLKDAYSVVEAIENFIVNKNVDNMGSILAVYEGAIEAEKLQKAGTKTRPVKSFFSKRFGLAWAEQIEQLQITMERMFGGVNAGIKVMRASGILDISQGKTKATIQSEKILKKYTDRFGKVKEFSSAENIFERKIISFMKRTINGSDIQRSIEFERRKRIIEETIDAMENGSELERRDAAIARKVYDKVLKDAKTPTEVSNNASDINNEAVDFWIEEFENIFDELQSVSRSVYNTILERDLNYTPDRFTRFDGNVDILDITSSSFAVGNETYNTNKSGTLMVNNRIKTLGAKPSRVLSFDFDSDMSNAMLNALIDINTAYAIRKVKGFYESDSFEKIVGNKNKEDLQLIKKRVKSFITKTKRKEYVPQSELSNAMKGINLLSQIAVGRALGSLAQIPKQTISVMANTMINSDGKLSFIDVINAKEFIDNSGYSIALRGIASNADLQNINKILERESESNAQEIQRGLNKAAEMWLNSFIARPDVWAARVSWITYYKESLRKQGIDADNIDWSTHEMNQKAGDYAQAQVNRQQNYSDSDFAGDLLGSKDPMKAYFRKILFPYMTFVFNQKSRQIADIATLSNKAASTEDKKIARKSLAGLAAEIGVYSLVGYFVKEVYAAIVNAVTGDEDEEEDKDKRLSNHLKYTAKTTINDLFSPVPNITDDVLESAINKLIKISDLDEKKFSIPESQDKSLVEMAMGQSFIIKEGMLNLERMSYAAATGTAIGEYKGTVYERQLSKEDQDLMKYVSVVYGAYLLGGVPADFGRLSEKVYRKLLKDSKKEKGSGGGGIKTTISTKIK